MNLLLLTFGQKQENHYQAVFCILTFLKDSQIKNIIMITDYPEFYRFLGDKVRIISIDENTLADWKGKNDFFWRIKIKALELAIHQYPNEHLLYVDSDTFLASNLQNIAQKLDKHIGLMHTFEYQLSAKNQGETVKRMYSTLKNKAFFDVVINEQSEMWNAGVIALPKTSAKKIIMLSLALCDAICETPCPCRLVEQFSFSLALNHLTELHPCDDVIGHYWGNKSEWNQLINQFFVNALLKQKTLAQCVEELNEFNWRSLPLEKKLRSTNSKLKRLIDKLFPHKHIKYLA
ncbi:hypothetical protein [Rodentibacter trehalosifermentans]|uniref:Glycosyl transferase n=1 Tax=Rodentibacter trehalosifermentans TaxID=1908263 RepID=A0A1V3INK8_9PAST|nr:hypothetical protein [Rodentibacter trehalosifermentans]OOF43711.1 hypothetical protein BKK51_11195 [Rodentibacter trehalosifermentans]OOF49739.1 hypothetical protein BKK52_02670 [Rodentibacter trehalosifermentans]OOF51651.1 hypothetical protein BKK53_07140 [Rodentibacter trehalosifermentans]